MSCPFSLGKCLSYKHQSLLLPPSWEQSGVCPFELPWQPTEEVVPTLSAKDKVTNDPWQQMRYPVFIHFFSWLKLHFFLIVLSTNCLWLYWWVDWNKFDDPQKSFLGKWCLRRWKKKKKKSWICWASMQSAMSVICLVYILVNVGKAKAIIV